MPLWTVDEGRLSRSKWQISGEGLVQLVLKTNDTFKIVTNPESMYHTILIKCANKPEDNETFGVFWSEYKPEKDRFW